MDSMNRASSIEHRASIALPLLPYEPAKENEVKLRLRFIVMSALLVVMAASYAWAKVVFDYDKAADFSGYSTFAWLERDNSIEAQLPDHLRVRLRRVTEEVLAEKGFDPAPAPPQTDFFLTFYYGARDQLEINRVHYSPYSPWGYGYWPGFNYGYTEVRSYKQGTLVLDIVDARTHQLVWMGTLEGEVRSTNPSGKRIQKSIKKLLKNFPPKK